MRKLLPTSLVVFLIFLSLNSYCQQPVIEIKSFDYIYCNTVFNRVIFALDDSAKLGIKNCFARAFKARWNKALPEVSFSVKPLPMFALKPKFKTQIKQKSPGKWYLFLQVYETVNDPDPHKDTFIPSSLEIRCMLVCSDNDSVILDKTLTVNINQPPVPFDQVPLNRLAAYPPSFVMGFDSIATWLFNPEPLKEKSLTLKPVCIFQKTAFISRPINKLQFHSNVTGIHQQLDPQFTFQLSKPLYEKIGVKRNIGGRSLGGLFTALTGVSSTKTKFDKYKADYSFIEKDSTYHCLIGYTEEETAEREKVNNGNGSFSMQSTDFHVNARYPDPSFQDVIIQGKDTLAKFSLITKSEASSLTLYDKMWDGRDSTSIIHLPADWNNRSPEKDIVISGKMGNNSFNMKTLKGKRIKDFYINDQLVTTYFGENEPENALLFQPVSIRQLKLFTILSSLPYAYLSTYHP